jgi:hypothetical protein
VSAWRGASGRSPRSPLIGTESHIPIWVVDDLSRMRSNRSKPLVPHRWNIIVRTNGARCWGETRAVRDRGTSRRWGHG